VAVIGGDVIGARLLARFGVIANLAVASVLIDIFVQLVCLFCFVLAGLGIVLSLVGQQQVSATAIGLLAIAVPAAAGFFLALNFSAFEPLVQWLVAFGEKREWSVFAHVVDLGARLLQQIWRNHRGLSESFVVHLAAVFFGAAEVWIALAFMGIPSASSRRWRSKAWGRGAARPPSCCRTAWESRTAR
jgi:glycosyltransferase 2 family protein